MQIQKIKSLFISRYNLYFPAYDKKFRIFYFLLLIALIRPIGFVFNSPVIDGIGATTCISPLPTVFSSPGGIESFSSEFYVIPVNREGKQDTIRLTSQHFLKMKGGHPFRNAVSLIIGYFPLFDEVSARKVLNYLIYDYRLFQEMGIPESKNYILINKNKSKEWKIEIRADKK